MRGAVVNYYENFDGSGQVNILKQIITTLF